MKEKQTHNQHLFFFFLKLKALHTTIILKLLLRTKHQGTYISICNVNFFRSLVEFFRRGARWQNISFWFLVCVLCIWIWPSHNQEEWLINTFFFSESVLTKHSLLHFFQFLLKLSPYVKCLCLPTCLFVYLVKMFAEICSWKRLRLES